MSHEALQGPDFTTQLSTVKGEVTRAKDRIFLPVLTVGKYGFNFSTIGSDPPRVFIYKFK